MIYAGDGGSATEATQVQAGSGDTTIYGGNGVDGIWGGTGDNLIYTGDGGTADAYTAVVAGCGNGTIVAGDGYNYLMGGSGQTTFESDQGSGTTVLDQLSDNDTILFGAGVTSQSLTLSATLDAQGALALTIEGSDGRSIGIVGGLTGSVTRFSFADSGTLTPDQLSALASSTPLNQDGRGRSAFLQRRQP